MELGDASLLKGRKPFDVIIANINRNILLNDLPAYTACMHSGSEIYMSGFYVEDIPAIRERGESLGQLGCSQANHEIKSAYVTLKAAFHTGSGSLFHIRDFLSQREKDYFSNICSNIR